jgi:hypothetical protein
VVCSREPLLKLGVPWEKQRLWNTGLEYIYSPPARRKSLCVWMATTLVRLRGNVYYQVDQRAATGNKYDTPESIK